MRKFRTEIDASELPNIFTYCETTGQFWWKDSSRARKPGQQAGCKRALEGYWVINYDYRAYQAHRIAWAIVHGRWPVAEIDHINGDPSDNRICNLREATRSQNEFNKGVSRVNTSGFKGVRWDPQGKRWGAFIYVEKQYHHLGFYHDKDEAVRVRREAEARFCGSYARAAE